MNAGAFSWCAQKRIISDSPLSSRPAKREDFGRRSLGKGHAIQSNVTADSTASEKAHYRDMVETHASAQLGMSHDTFSGVKDDRFEMALARLPDAKGPRAPSKLSLRTILRKMRFMDKPLFLCLIRTDKKQGFDVFYDGNCPIVCSYVHEFLKCPAAQIMFWLLHRGFKKPDVETFLNKVFSRQQLQLCPKASYNDKIKLAQVKALDGDVDILTASRRKDNFINTDLGLSAERIKVRKAQLEATVCTLGNFDFSRPQDLRSLHGDGSVADWSVDQSLGASIYRVANSAAATEDDDDDDDGDDEDDDEDVEIVDGATASSPQVRFAMELPGGGTSDTLLLPDQQQRHPPSQASATAAAATATDTLTGGEMGEDDSQVSVRVATYRQFARTLWGHAPENYDVLHDMLNQLEFEYLLLLGEDTSDIVVPSDSASLVDDNLRQLLVDAAHEGEIVEFIDDIRLLLSNKARSEEEADELIKSIFGEEFWENMNVKEVEDFDERSVQDANNATVLLSSRLPPSENNAMQVDGLGDGSSDPQGSLLPASRVAASGATGDVETAPAGGASG